MIGQDKSEVFTSEQLPPGHIMVMVKSRDGTELAFVIGRDLLPFILEPIEHLLSAADEYEERMVLQ